MQFKISKGFSIFRVFLNNRNMDQCNLIQVLDK